MSNLENQKLGKAGPSLFSSFLLLHIRRHAAERERVSAPRPLRSVELPVLHVPRYWMGNQARRCPHVLLKQGTCCGMVEVVMFFNRTAFILNLSCPALSTARALLVRRVPSLLQEHTSSHELQLGNCAGSKITLCRSRATASRGARASCPFFGCLMPQCLICPVRVSRKL